LTQFVLDGCHGYLANSHAARIFFLNEREENFKILFFLVCKLFAKALVSVKASAALVLKVIGMPANNNDHLSQL
jgi:hypothetical protein